MRLELVTARRISYPSYCPSSVSLLWYLLVSRTQHRIPEHRFFQHKWPCSFPQQKQKSPLPEGEATRSEIGVQFIAFKETADWLIGVKFQRG